MTMTKTRTPRSMDEIGAGDIAVGQRWAHRVTEKARQRVYWLASIKGDTAVMQAPLCDDMTVSFGSLLSDWVLVEEA